MEYKGEFEENGEQPAYSSSYNNQGYAPKRRLDENDDQEFKRSRVNPIYKVIEDLSKEICELGESTQEQLIEDLEFISIPISKEFEKEDIFRNNLLELIYNLILEQPHKLIYISGLIQLSNAKNFLIGKFLLEFLHQKIQLLVDDEVKKSALVYDSGNLNKIKIVLRFLACLSPIVNEYQVIEIFNQFLVKAIELKETCIGEQIFYNIVSSIPYLLVGDKSDTMKEHCSSLMKTAEEFSIIEKTAERLDLFNPFENNGQIETVDIVTSILGAIQAIQANSWDFGLFIDINSLIQTNLTQSLVNNTLSNELVQHSLPKFNLTHLDKLDNGVSHGIIDEMWQNPRIIYQLLVNPLRRTQPVLGSYENLILKDIIYDILVNLEFNRKEITRQLITLDLFFSKDYFVEIGTTIEELNNSGSSNTWKIEDIIIDNLLSLILQVTKVDQQKLVSAHYYTIIIESCMKLSTSIAPVLGRSIRFLYNNLNNLKFETRYKFIDWLSIQLANFNFTWKWKEWETDLALMENATYLPRKVFVKNLVLKEIQLSNRARIEESLIDSFKPFVYFNTWDEKKIERFDLRLFGEDFIPFESHDYNSNVQEVKFDYLGRFKVLEDFVVKLNEELTVEQFDELLPNLDDVSSSSQEARISSLLQVFLYLGSRSTSHIQRLLLAKKPLIEHLFKDQENKDKLIIESIIRFWNGNTQIVAIIFKHLIKMGLLDQLNVLKYIVDEELVFNFNFFKVFIDYISKENSGAVKEFIDEKMKQEREDDDDLDWYYSSYTDLLKILERNF